MLRSALGASFRFLGLLLWTILLTLTSTDIVGGSTHDALSPGHREWLTEVEPILTESEKRAFSALRREYQRDAFIHRFWTARGYRPQWEQRRTLAEELFGGLDNERARTLMLLGTPELMLRDLCPELARPLETWYYGHSEAFADGFYLAFVRQSDETDADFVHWRSADGVESLFRPAALANQDLDTLLSQLYRRCSNGRQMAEAAAALVDWDELQAEGSLFPPQPERWVDELGDWIDPEAADPGPLAATPVLQFPGRFHEKTVAQVELNLPRELVTTSGADGTFNLKLEGELLRQDRLNDLFRYHFDLPVASISGGTIPMVFQRYLLPGAYTLILRLEDLNTGRFYAREDPIRVPRPDIATMAPQSPLAEANSVLMSTDSWVKIEPLANDLLIGKVRVLAEARGEDIAKVTFVLNGRPVMSKTRPPYGMEIDLGQAPRLHSLEAVAYDSGGEEVARDRVPVNAGPHRFAIRLLEPRPGQPYIQSLRAAAEVDLPADESVERVDFYLNETRLASLFQPPYALPILLPENQRITYVRAVAYLDDGNATEDLVFINAPKDMGHLRINMVELYTTVSDRKGRPVEGLTREAFQVREEGNPHDIRRFELVRDRSIHAGVVLDASTSMEEEIEEAIDSALRFFETVIQPRDRAAAVVFNDEPMLRVPFTNDIGELTAGLEDVNAEGETALFDTLVFTLHYFSGLRGKRALILISDGEDSRSRFSFPETLEFAQRSGVAIYSIALGLDRRAMETRNVLTRLASETGGRFFSISGAHELDRIYETIEQELRSQYLLVYQSTHEEGGDFRRVKVDVAADGLKARTIPGYYP